MASSKYTTLNYAEDVLKTAGVPLTERDIWEKGGEILDPKNPSQTLQEKLGSNGETTWKTIGALIYTSIQKQGTECKFQKVYSHPTRFGLTELKYAAEDTMDSEDAEGEDAVPPVSNIQRKGKTPKSKQTEQNTRNNERNIHALLTSFVSGNEKFLCHTKTILHEKSGHKAKGLNTWLHPDVVGVYFPLNDYHDATRDLAAITGENLFRIFSFEVKRVLTMGTLKENYFQAVSNSSWAHEGYLVAVDLPEEDDFRKELGRLSSAFGIGVIRLNLDDIVNSSVLFPAKSKEELDWDTIDRITKENLDFRVFIEQIKIHKNNIDINKEFYPGSSKFDEVLDAESDELAKAIDIVRDEIAKGAV